MSSAATSRSAARGRALVLSAALIAALGVLFGGAGGAGAVSLVTASTSTTLTVTSGPTVTFSSTVTASDGTTPTGFVDFNAQYTAPGASGSVFEDLGQGNLSGGSASFGTTTLPAGTYRVTAVYNPAGSVAWNSSSSASVPLTVASVQPATTQLSLTESAQTIDQNQSVTLTTTLTTAAGQPAPTGIVRFSAGSDANHLVTVGQASIVGGTATLTKGGWDPGSYVLVAYYDGDGVYATAASGQVALTVNRVSIAVATTTTVTLSPGTIASGALVTITAHVVKTGTPNPPPGGPIVSFVGGPVGSDPSSWVRVGTPGQATLDANGNASETVGGWSPGTYVLVAQYPGDLHDESSSGSAILTVIAATGGVPVLTYTGASGATWGDSATLSGTLTAPGGAAISGETVGFTLGPDSCSTTTDAAGHASCQVTVDAAPGAATVVGASNGDATYPGVRTAADFAVGARPTSVSVANVTAAAGGTAHLSATLVDQATGSPIGGEPVSLSVGPATCAATTSGAGVAACDVAASAGVGAHDIAAAFGGDGGYLASGGTGTLTITQIPAATTTRIAAVGPLLAGAPVTLSASVSPSAASGAVVFSSGGTTLCTATLSGGSASCSTSFAQAGASAVTATYGGDGLYPASSDSTSVLVYALAPGGGAFVVGDRSAAGAVSFWGAQWWKANVLSGGAAPSSFKGFASRLSAPVCGATWSTDPGNSSPPPAGPLPAYMAVVVASAASKSGAQVSGTVAAIVIVKTDAGYLGDPGHAGTGTVVATLCGGR